MIRDNLDYIHAHPEIYFTQEAKKADMFIRFAAMALAQTARGLSLSKGNLFATNVSNATRREM